MKIHQLTDGGVLKSAREYDIAANTAVHAGQVVALSGGLVIPAVAAQTGAILGIAAETHTGVTDAINPRANGTKIMVWDAPNLIMKCAAPRITAASGSTTTLVAATLATFAANDFTGGYVRLVEKAEGSTNADAIGQVRRITASAADTKTFTLESGGTPVAGDVYEVFPPLGFAKGNLDAELSGLSLAATAALALKVVGHDRDLGYINMMAGKHFLADAT